MEKDFDRAKFQECKAAVQEMLAAQRQRIEDRGICDQALEDALKDLEWAVNTAERLLGRVTGR
ncbi:MAG: hypothetical protein HPY50_17355 [Firmicutes bacterium]|nr:hypothetical protein [Bacillota bacterium]